jgi:mono/diheme cytochrome c family protein
LLFFVLEGDVMTAVERDPTVAALEAQAADDEVGRVVYLKNCSSCS